MKNLEWMDWFHIADCAARVFKDEMPRENPHSHIGRAFTRTPCVKALRAMWRTGDRELRSLVIARVTVWCWGKTDNYDCGARIKAIEARVLGPKPERTSP